MSLNLFCKDDLDEVVFENRNKQYGAYALRKSYDSNLLKASASSFGFVFFVVGSVYLASILHQEIKPIAQSIQLPPIENRLTDIKIILDPPVSSPANILRNQAAEIFTIVKDRLVKPSQISPPETINTNNNAGPHSGDGLPQTGQTSLPGISPFINTPAVPSIVSFAEVMPSFPGGQEALLDYLSKNINYPIQAVENGIEGKVIVSFIVQTDGSIGQLNIVRGINFGCDDEAKRVILTMPKWNIGKQNGKPVAVKLVLPILFQLQ